MESEWCILQEYETGKVFGKALNNINDVVVLHKHAVVRVERSVIDVSVRWNAILFSLTSWPQNIIALPLQQGNWTEPLFVSGLSATLCNHG